MIKIGITGSLASESTVVKSYLKKEDLFLAQICNKTALPKKVLDL